MFLDRLQDLVLKIAIIIIIIIIKLKSSSAKAMTSAKANWFSFILFNLIWLFFIDLNKIFKFSLVFEIYVYC